MAVMDQEGKAAQEGVVVDVRIVLFVTMVLEMEELVEEAVAKVAPVALEVMVEEHLLRFTYTTMEATETLRIVI
jgi:hypothetical protein